MDDQRFNYCVNVVLGHEGGLSYDKNDSGGITKYGISLRWARSVGVAETPGDIIKLTKKQAIGLYRKYWWDAYGFDRLRAIDIAAKIFDMSVNLGEYAAIELLQRAINCFRGHQIIVDGKLGNETILCSNVFPPNIIHDKLRQLQEEHYRLIIAAHPKDKVFLNGWLRRAAW